MLAVEQPLLDSAPHVRADALLRAPQTGEQGTADDVQKDETASPKIISFSSISDACNDLGRLSRCAGTPRGLHNLRNSCYLNSALQALIHQDALISQMLEAAAGRSDTIPTDRKDVQLAYAFGSLAVALKRGPRDEAEAPRDMLEALVGWNSSFAGNFQQDAHEALRTLLDGLDDALQPGVVAGSNNPAVADDAAASAEESSTAEAPIQSAVADCSSPRVRRPSVVEQLFQGQITSSITCDSCGMVSQTNEHCLDLSIEVVQRRGSGDSGLSFLRGLTGSFARRRTKQKPAPPPLLKASTSLPTIMPSSEPSPPVSGITLDACLSSFFATEQLEGAERYACECCDKLCDAHKNMQIQHAPPLLMVHLKRFSCKGSSASKNADRVQFPVHGLDLAPYSAPGADCDRYVYDLTAVVAHHGVSPSSGHYTAYVRGMTAKCSNAETPNSESTDAATSTATTSTTDAAADLSTDGALSETPTSPAGGIPADVPAGVTAGPPRTQWYCCNDTKVTAVNEEQLRKAEAYVLFYARRERTPQEMLDFSRVRQRDSPNSPSFGESMPSDDGDSSFGLAVPTTPTTPASATKKGFSTRDGSRGSGSRRGSFSRMGKGGRSRIHDESALGVSAAGISSDTLLRDDHSMSGSMHGGRMHGDVHRSDQRAMSEPASLSGSIHGGNQFAEHASYHEGSHTVIQVARHKAGQEAVEEAVHEGMAQECELKTAEAGVSTQTEHGATASAVVGSATPTDEKVSENQIGQRRQRVHDDSSDDESFHKPVHARQRLVSRLFNLRWRGGSSDYIRPRVGPGDDELDVSKHSTDSSKKLSMDVSKHSVQWTRSRSNVE